MSTTSMTSTVAPAPLLPRPQAPSPAPSTPIGTATVDTIASLQHETQKEFRSWSELDRAEQLACISTRPCLNNYGDLAAWNAVGCLVQKWNNSICTHIKGILNHEENQKEVRGRRLSNTKKYLPSPILVMLSLTGVREDAVPYIVLMHQKLKVAKKAATLLQDDRLVAAFDFCFLAWANPIRPSAAEKSSSQPSQLETERTDMSLCGRAIQVSSIQVSALPLNRDSRGRLATVGGVLKLAEYSYYALTSAHVFADTGHEDSPVDGESDQEPDVVNDVDFSGMNSDSDDSENDFSFPPAPEAHAVFLRAGSISTSPHQIPPSADQESISPRHIGNAFTDRGGEFPTMLCNPKLDWALVEITDPRFWDERNQICVQQQVLHPDFRSARDPSPEEELVVLTEFPNLARGKSIGAKSAIELPWRAKLVEAWAVECRTGMTKAKHSGPR